MSDAGKPRRPAFIFPEIRTEGREPLATPTSADELAAWYEDTPTPP
jgi:hypothetical protein